MKLILSSRARRDLQDIGDWIARDDIDTAAAFVADLGTKARQIAMMPLAFPYDPRLKDRGVRKRSVRGHLILYRVDTSAVRILRIVNGRRDYAKLFT